MKYFAIITLACIAQALAGPVARDLAADVSSARTALDRWDKEINNFQGRLNYFNDEISLTISDIYNEIKMQLTETAVPSAEIDILSNLIDDTLANAIANVTGAADALTIVRENVIATSEALQGDLSGLAAVTATLKMSNTEANTAFTDMTTNVQADFGAVDMALREALQGQNGTPVIQILVSLQRVTDIVDNERFELTNAQIIYDFRAEAAFTALQVVIDQA